MRSVNVFPQVPEVSRGVNYLTTCSDAVAQSNAPVTAVKLRQQIHTEIVKTSQCGTAEL